MVRRRIAVRRSPIHGQGVYALVDIAQGERIIEYAGELISWAEALERHPHDLQNPNHTFYFGVDEQHVLDGNVDGNSARCFNHACMPNCSAEQRTVNGRERIYLHATRAIARGEELSFDYGLTFDARLTRALKDAYRCLCGTPVCRGTMLSVKRRSRAPRAA
ncbi:SET domain-containing protein-lysine N-methyltransferase [soil metagenome]